MQLEHTDSEKLIKRLDAFVGHPKFDPHGDPIPDENGNIQKLDETNLASFQPPDEFTVVGLKDHSSNFFKELTARRIALGSRIRLLKKFEYDRSIVVEVDGKEQTLSSSVCRNLIVNLISLRSL